MAHKTNFAIKDEKGHSKEVTIEYDFFPKETTGNCSYCKTAKALMEHELEIFEVTVDYQKQKYGYLYEKAIKKINSLFKLKNKKCCDKYSCGIKQSMDIMKLY